MKTKNYLILLDKNQTKIPHWNKIKYKELYQDLIDIATSLNYKPLEFCWIIINKKSPSRCIICNKNAKFISLKKGYAEICSNKCGYELKKCKCSKKLKLAWDTRGDEINQKRKNTCIEKFNVEHVLQSKEIQDKCHKTKISKYGSNYKSVLSTSGNNKRKETMMNKYGVNNPFQMQSTKDILLSKYGFDNAAKNIKVKNKMSKSAINRQLENKNLSYKRKQYQFKSGKIILVQGYEPFAIDLLLSQGINEDDIKTGKDCPKIIYNDHNRYLPDIFIESLNLLIEVKSEWTFNIDKEKNLLKQKSSIDSGYNHEIWIMNSKQLIRKI